MTSSLVAAAALLGAALILSVAVYVFGRLRIEQQRSLQRGLEQGRSIAELATLIGLASPAARDQRRGILLMALGFAWSLVTFFIGGKAWLFGAVPILLGIAFLLLSRTERTAA